MAASWGLMSVLSKVVGGAFEYGGCRELSVSGLRSGVGFVTPSALLRQAFDDDNGGDVDVEDYAAFQEYLVDF